jgi:anti-anti-sigma factor
VLRGELDRAAARDVTAAVRPELIDGRPVIVELAGLDFIDVQGVRALVRLVAQGERCRGRAGVEVHGARGQPARLIRLLGYEQTLAAPPLVGAG